MSEAKGGTSFFKVFLAILAAFVLIGGCVLGGCAVMMRACSQEVSERISTSEKERQDYVRSMSAKVTGQEVKYGQITVRGSVSNNGSQTVSFWKVNVRFLDTAGSVIDRDSRTSAFVDLAPNESVNWQVMRRHDPRTASVEADVESVRLR